MDIVAVLAGIRVIMWMIGVGAGLHYRVWPVVAICTLGMISNFFIGIRELEWSGIVGTPLIAAVVWIMINYAETHRQTVNTPVEGAL